MSKADEMERAADAMARLLDATLVNNALKGTAKFYEARIRSGVNILIDGAAAVRQRDLKRGESEK